MCFDNFLGILKPTIICIDLSLLFGEYSCWSSWELDSCRISVFLIKYSHFKVTKWINQILIFLSRLARRTDRLGKNRKPIGNKLQLYELEPIKIWLQNRNRRFDETFFRKSRPTNGAGSRDQRLQDAPCSAEDERAERKVAKKSVRRKSVDRIDRFAGSGNSRINKI